MMGVEREVITMDDEVYDGDTWYVIDEGTGQETPYRNPFRAHMALDKLTGPGRIETYNGLTKHRTVTAVREADGSLTDPQVEVDA